MATTAGEALGAGAPRMAGGETTVAQFIDRWIYVIMAAWFIVTALVGFVPTSIGKTMAVQAGFRPPFPPVLHIHALLMGSWLMLLLAQSWLLASGRRSGHMQLGLVATVLAPAMVVTGALLVPTMFRMNWTAIAAAPPEFLPYGVDGTRSLITSLVAAQTMIGLLFPLFVTWALLVRHRDSEMHKRLMILATAMPLPAAIDRMSWMPTSYPDSALSPIAYVLIWVLPMFAWDLFRLRRIHRAYVAWLAIYLPTATVVYFLWPSPGFAMFVQRTMGVA